MTLLWKSCTLLLLATAAEAFTSQRQALHPAFRVIGSNTGTNTDSTRLYISSWGTKGPPSRWADTEKRENIEQNVQAYLKEPEAVEARVNVDGTCLVSGLVKSKERTDQTIFDLLNHEDSAFEFDKIVAFVDDMKFAKKRLLSRSARYTGLLDKLDFREASAPGALPTTADLEGVKSWVAYLEVVDDKDQVWKDLEQIAKLAKEAPSVENVAVLLTGANELDASASAKAVEAFKGDENLSYSLVAVGKLEEHAEGSIPYRYNEFGSEEGMLGDQAIFSRDESLRMVTEMLQLECGVNKALAFREIYNVNATEARLIKGLRGAGYARPQEIDHMIREGPEAYAEAVQKWKTENPDAAKGYTTDAWWEGEQFQKSVRRRNEKAAEKEQEKKDARQIEIEKIATEWATRDFFRQSTSAEGTDLKEEEYIKEVWERALLEGDLKYRQMNGEAADPDKELADFKARQERKQQVLLQKAKDELKSVLDEEDLGDVPILTGKDEDDDADE